VFVGAGPLAFAAREAALKVMELSAGRIPALWDSTLGFRHGPKSFVHGATDIWVFLSAEAHAARYDADLVAELRGQFPASRVTAVGPGGDVDMPTDGAQVVLPVVLAQMLAVVWSDALGLPVDDPFAGQGTLSRVVSGVTLYPVLP
jgi:tagatose-6-phosphate ketose/aldose isomerase